MRYYTHLAFSFIIGMFLIKYLSISNQILFIVLFLFASLLPDIDEAKSKVSQQVKPLAWLINFIMGHRGLMHSIWIPVLLYLLLFKIKMAIAIAISFGYLSHLVLDCFTVSGLRLLWPWKKRMKGFIVTGSLWENLLFILFLMIGVYLLITF